MKFLDDIAVQMISANEEERIPTLARALRQSLVVPRRIGLPRGPQQIAKQVGLNLATLVDARIILVRKEAAGFLHEFCRLSRSELLRDTLTAARYEDVFQRDISKWKKSFIYTYAELLVLAEDDHPPEFPNQLKLYLDR
ncbi:MAG: hypothetical protein AAGM22_24665 [Acidobacteriota bacterium]